MLAREDIWWYSDAPQNKTKIFGCTYKRISILEYGSVWQQYANYSTILIVENVNIFIRNSPASDVNGERLFEYHDVTAQIRTESYLCLYCGSPSPTGWKKQYERWFIEPYQILLIITFPGILITRLLSSQLSAVFRYKGFRNCSSCTSINIVKLPPYNFCWHSTIQARAEFCCPFCLSGFKSSDHNTF